MSSDTIGPRPRTPLADLLSRGEAPVDVRRLAARGELTTDPVEQMLFLVLALDDADPQVREEATHTLEAIPRQSLSALLARPEVDPEVRAALAKRGIDRAEDPGPDPDEPLVKAGEPPESEPAVRVGVLQRLSLMTVAERVKTAMRGNREERSVLIRDSVRLVAVAVLSNPKLTESEIEGFAKMTTVSEDVLRIIGHSRAWAKRYAVAAALAFNPKTPLAVSMGLVPRLAERDIKRMSLDRNLPEPLRLNARKIASSAESRRH
jgi:hypothetical protein